MKTLLLPLLPLLAVSGAVSAQDSALVATSGGQPVILIADSQKPAPKSTPKTSPQPPLQFRFTPQLETTLPQRILNQPRFAMPIAQHDLSQYPMPVTAGKGQPVRIPVAPPK